jgi:hypothetical protein
MADGQEFKMGDPPEGEREGLGALIAPSEDPPILRNVVSVVEQVYWQPALDQPQQLLESACGRELESDEQPYVRRLVVNEEWRPIDCGWIGDECGMFLLCNEEGKHLHKNPTPEQKASLDEKVVELRFDRNPTCFWYILPGESMRGCPSNAQSLFIRCRSGTARVTLTLLPR